MAMERFNDDLNIVGGLGDDPKRDDGLSTPQFKSVFDKAGLLIQDFINNKLIPFIEKQNVGLPIGGGTMEGGINMNGQSLSGLNAPTKDDEAANKGYVDQHTNPPLPGVIYPYSGANIPEGFLLCDGAAYSRTEYPELFAAIGTMYGEGDGSTTFNVPDLVERVPAGAGGNHAVGEMVGEETHTLTEPEIASHAHKGLLVTGIGMKWKAGYAAGSSYGMDTGESGDNGDFYTANAGGSQPHNNMQPTTYIRGYIIATGKGSGVSVQDIISGVQALPLGIEYGGTGATDAKTARDNLGITPENIGALSMELLWENASPNSGFAAGNVNISNLSKYDAVIVEGRMNTDSYFDEYKLQGTLCFIGHCTTMVSTYDNIDGSGWSYRVFEAFTNGVYFHIGHRDTGTADNGAAIPVKIYGIKF